MFFDHDLITHAEKVIKIATTANVRFCLAESCSGGLVAALLTEIEGASAVLDRSVIVYSKQAKVNLLDIDESIIEKFGIISQQVADAMAVSVAQIENCVSLGITGIAGKYRDKEKDQGLVYISSFNSKTKNLISKKYNFSGGRFEIRKSILFEAMTLLELNIKPVHGTIV